MTAGLNFRSPVYRREVFLRFYQWSLDHASFPGGVHYVLPHLARVLDWDTEDRYWFAWLNGNTQNPVTSLAIMQYAPHLSEWPEAVAFQDRHWKDLQWDTDRRHQKGLFARATEGYAEVMNGSQARYFRPCNDWQDYWRAASALPGLGRLSTWSYLEYLRILNLGVPDAETLMLEDINGSRSHRNGLALATGWDNWIVDKQLGPQSTDAVYTPHVLTELGWLGQGLLKEAEHRTGGHPHLGYLSLESALCTYKSWHKRNRRYPGVYNDLLYDRLLRAEDRLGHRFGAIWDARLSLPRRLRLEDNPRDPGCVPVKQNWYLDHGEVINMTTEWPCFANSFEAKVATGAFGERPVR